MKKNRQALKKETGKHYFADDNLREPSLGVVVGERNIGKTFQSILNMKDYVLGSEKLKPRRALVMDINNEYTFIKPINLSDLKEWSNNGIIEARKISIFKTTADADLMIDGKPIYFNPSGKMSLKEFSNVLFYVLNNYHDGMLLVEDITKYVSDNLPSDLIGALCTNRHSGIDTVLQFQFMDKYAHPKIIGNANWLRYHKTKDNIDINNKNYGDALEPLLICETLINKKYRQTLINKKQNKYENKSDYKKDLAFYVYWDTDDYKIKGAFSQKEFALAVIDYLEINYNRIVKKKLNQIDLLSGTNKFTNRDEFLRKMILEYIDDYYGN